MTPKSKGSILIVDDDPYILESVSLILNEYDYSISTCNNAADAMKKLRDNMADIILTDIRMPGGSGLELLKKIHSFNSKIPVILMTAYTDIDLAIGAVKSGAFDFIPKPYKPEQLLHTIEKAVSHNKLVLMESNYTHTLEDIVRTKTQEVVELSREVIKRLTTIAEFRDTDTGAHISRIGLFSNKIAEYMEMPVYFIEAITYTSALHDIGKIGIQDEILLKSGSLTTEEFEIIKTHTTIGEKMLSGSTNHVIQMAASIALNHHERWDGSGYPKGLRGEDIPIEGRIVNICDQYDALMSKRPYKSSLVHREVFKVITEGDGRTMPEHFDIDVLNAFKELAPVFNEIYITHQD